MLNPEKTGGGKLQLKLQSVHVGQITDFEFLNGAY